MHSDLEHLIRLQQLDLAAEDARHLIATVPERSGALDAQLDAARSALADARARKAANEAERRTVEKDRAAVKVRRSKYADQTMEVKTNREFHALQKEIEVADQEIGRFDDRDLELMLEADEIGAAMRAADQALKQAEQRVAAERRALEQESREAVAALGRIADERRELVAHVTPSVLHTFEQLASHRRGLAMAEAKDGLCAVCHVRLRPQVYSEARRNDRIVQCESCGRILYFVAPASPRQDAPA
jgi:uncharacterized protein